MNGFRELQTIRPNDEPAPPHNIEAEQQLLGSLLTNNDLMASISNLLDPGDFFDPLHRWLYTRISEKIAAAELVSIVTMRLEIEAPSVKAGFDEVGGRNYLIRLVGNAISSYALREYAQMIADLSAKRKLLAIFEDTGRKIREAQLPASKLSLDAETAIGAVSSKTSVKPLIRSYQGAMVRAITQINDAFMGEKTPGLSTGIRDLDRMIGHMRPGQMIILGGRPSMGKTSLAQNIAWAAMKQGKTAFYGSLEMTGEELVPRFLSLGLSEAGHKIAYKDMIAGSLEPHEMRLVLEEGQRQESLPLYLAERDVREISRFRAAARRCIQRCADTAHPVGVIVIDYVQLLESALYIKTIDRVSAASDMCKSLALEFNLPVLVLSQLSRGVEQRDPPIPIQSDLREAGRLEEDADVVLFTYRDEYYLRGHLEGAISKGDDKKAMDYRIALEAVRGHLDIIVAKQRNGSTGTARAFIDLAHCRVMEDLHSNVDRLI